MFGFSDSTPPALQLERIERKLDLIMGHLGLHLPEDPWEQEARALIAKGRTIEAIKRVRELTGAGLKEAKAMVDGLQR